MTYKLPEPVGLAEPTQALSLAKDLLSDGRRYSAEQMQAAYAAGQRDMLERCVEAAKNERLTDNTKEPTDLAYNTAISHVVYKLKELLNEQH